MKVGGKYNWKGQPERLVYIGRNWSGNGYWHQFEKVGEPGVVWCEVVDADLAHFEESEPAPASPLPEAAEPVAGWNWMTHPQWNDGEPTPVWIETDGDDKWYMPVDIQQLTQFEWKEREADWKLYATPSPVAQAPAQAGEVARLAEWHRGQAAHHRYAAKTTACDAKLEHRHDFMGEGCLKAAAWHDEQAALLAALATQPLAAPVQQEAEAVAWQERQEVSPGRFGEWYERRSGWSLTREREITSSGIRYQFRPLYTTPLAHPVLAPVVREPLTEAEIWFEAREGMLNAASGIYATKVVDFARAIERAHGIQATTGEAS